MPQRSSQTSHSLLCSPSFNTLLSTIRYGYAALAQQQPLATGAALRTRDPEQQITSQTSLFSREQRSGSKDWGLILARHHANKQRARAITWTSPTQESVSSVEVPLINVSAPRHPLFFKTDCAAGRFPLNQSSASPKTQEHISVSTYTAQIRQASCSPVACPAARKDLFMKKSRHS